MRVRLQSIVQLPRCVGSASSSSNHFITGATESSNCLRLLPKSLSATLYRNHKKHTDSMQEETVFKPKKVLILSKITRYEFEKRVHNDVPEAQLESILSRRGSDYAGLLAKHHIHHQYLSEIQKQLEDAGVESRVVQRFDYDDNIVKWADAILSAGGDGTFLLAASRIRDRNIPVIGINTDPQGSEGYMCLMRKLPREHFKDALQRLLKGDFQWLYRQRIRITLTGEHGVGDSIELHDQQLNRDPSTTRWVDNPRSIGENEHEHTPPSRKRRAVSDRVTIQLPVLALNEVFIGESLSSRVSYYEIQINNGPMVKQKSSGIAICTGTGSTSWYFNINKLTDQCVKDLLTIISEECKVKLPSDDQKVVSEICTRFNQQLLFHPDILKMAFSVRDPVFNSTFPPTAPRGQADIIRVKSRGYDAHLVVDGGVSYRFNDGSEALLDVREEDALKTVVFR